MTKLKEHDAKLTKFSGVETTRFDLSHISGCMCKLSGNDLCEILTDAWGGDYTHQPEDCAVVVAGDVTLLLTTDLGPLVGTNQFKAGRIAALHAMSDIFASGGRPTHALVNLVIKQGHPLSYSKAVMSGIIATCSEEGVKIVGGQTIIGGEAMAGLSVVGIPGKRIIIRKTGARPGQKLLISKPLGVGLVVRAFKLGLLSRESLDEAVEIMCTSNRRASAALLDAGVSTATDVTGFGLLGHLSEMLGKNLGAKIKSKAIPYIQSVLSLPDGVGNTSFIKGNFEYAKTRCNIINNNSANLDLLLDPQTNGGLLAVADDSDVEKLTASGFALIGEITNGNDITIE